MAKILIPLAEGFEEIEAVALIDILRRGELDVLVYGVGSKKVCGAHGIVVECDGLIEESRVEELDMILLPGGWGGTRRLAEDGYVLKLLQDMDEKGKIVGAMCAAPFALRKAGVLRGEFTCYPGAREEIGVEGYTDKAMVVTSGNIMTSQGPGTAMCFGLEIVRRFRGDGIYNALKRGMLIDSCR